MYLPFSLVGSFYAIYKSDLKSVVCVYICIMYDVLALLSFNCNSLSQKVHFCRFTIPGMYVCAQFILKRSAIFGKKINLIG